ncbi:hypothetical protein SAMN05421866_3407 [Chryseobacterium oranimense]|uniref:Inhibitor of vertebrate lysozyme (Ivy) n=1 Tax=Chryseobacterium oranimense TaxID=421058 RepID=A0A1M5UVP4_9FLAO|nr:hypothetical protein [Chryseobacterium oranimense]SHH66996.1 hypothetical protein SAMN05421866_3407 [Chryseobacterium oranimense]
MKKLILNACAFSLLTVVSCKKETKIDPSPATIKDSVTIKADSASSSASSSTRSIITNNIGKYPHDIKLFENKDFTDRVKRITGAQYDEIFNNFNVESQIVSENGIYKVTGCKQHDCPGYSTSIFYDSKNDNLNVAIDKNGKITDFTEKEKIKITDVLKSM